MSVVMQGKEFKLYYSDPECFPDGAFHDDTLFLIDGKDSGDTDMSEIPDNVTVTIESGRVFFPDGKDCDMEDQIVAWREKQTTSFGRFSAPKELMAAVVEAIKAAGGTYQED